MTKDELQSFRKYIVNDKSEIIRLPNYEIAIFKNTHHYSTGLAPSIVAQIAIFPIKNNKLNYQKPIYKTFENFLIWLEENNIMNEFETKLEEIILKRL